MHYFAPQHRQDVLRRALNSPLDAHMGPELLTAGGRVQKTFRTAPSIGRERGRREPRESHVTRVEKQETAALKTDGPSLVRHLHRQTKPSTCWDSADGTHGTS